MEPRQHMVAVEELEGLTADGSTAYQAACACGWGGKLCYFEGNALAEGEAHKEDPDLEDPL